MSPGNPEDSGRHLLVTVHFINGEQKTLPTERRPAALQTLSRQQDESGYTKFNK
jgi:hypothetical protein